MGRASTMPPAEFLILLALADGAKHGHGIKVDVAERTEARINMGPGTLYGAIKRLLRRGWIEEVTDAMNDLEDERLRYYAATGEGLAAAHDEATRMASLVGMAQAKSVIG